MNEQSVYLGQPLYSTLYAAKTGYIFSIGDDEKGVFSIGSGSMVPVGRRLKVVWDDKTISTDTEEGVKRYAELAKSMKIKDATVEQMNEMRATAENRAEEVNRKIKEQREAFEASQKEFIEKYRDKVPSWAKAVIVAEHTVDQSDIMSDYFGSSIDEVIILGFSKHTRDLFPELRKAAANAPETAHLAIKPGKPATADKWWKPADEHREKYSMGGGFFLKEGGQHSTGWKVSKKKFYRDSDKITEIPIGRWAVNDVSTVKKVAPAPLQGGTQGLAAHIEEHVHTKKGFTMYMVVLDDRVESDKFNELRDAAKAAGGWYSRKWGATPCGFAFEEREQAEAFLATLVENPIVAGDHHEDDAQPKPQKKSTGDHLRLLAEKLQKQIDDKMGDRLTNTPKRLAQANHARFEGNRLQRTQDALKALAALHDAGTVPQVLQGITTKKGVYDLMGEKREMVPNGYHSYSIGTGKPNNDDPATLAMWSLLEDKSPEQKAAEEMQRKIDGLKFLDIPGYFPTPAAVISQMFELANIEKTDEVLEPNLGSCAIADAVLPLCYTVEGYEVNHTLAEICQEKGYLCSCSDFLTVMPQQVYDKVLMNPPFENLQDIDHVQHAFKFLKEDGGTLVAVMSPGPFFRSNRKAVEFRKWFYENGGEKFDLPEGSFKESGTMVASCLVVISK